MKFDYQCHFNVQKELKKLGLEDHGRVQMAIDEAFLTGVEPYTPFLEGYLINSAIQHTDVGSGLIIWDCDNKARRLYYGEMEWNWSNDGVQQGGLRGPYWAERYIQNGGREEIERVARSVVGG